MSEPARSERGSPEFVAGFAARHNAAAAALVRAFPVEGTSTDFVAEHPGARPVAAPRPRHFSPADPNARPTAGWDPLDPRIDQGGVDQPGQTRLDPLQAAHAAGYAEGFAAAAAAREAETRDRGLLAELTAQLAGAARIDREGIARRLRQTVLSLTTRLVGDVGVSAERLAGRIEVAAELLGDEAESALLRVHPDDVALLEGRLPKTIFAAGDASVARGGFVLESASTTVEDGPDLWLDRLAEAIDRVPLPISSESEASC